jgi:tetratricopeptide (TPR) repeat protein
VHAQRGEWAAGSAAIDSAVSLEPRVPFALAVRAYLRARHGQTKPALDDASAAIELDPQAPLGYASRAYARAVASGLSPDAPGVNLAGFAPRGAPFARGDLARGDSGKPDPDAAAKAAARGEAKAQAFADVAAAVERASQDPFVYYVRALVGLEFDDLDRAVEDSKLVLAARPGWSEAHILESSLHVTRANKRFYDAMYKRQKVDQEELKQEYEAARAEADLAVEAGGASARPWIARAALRRGREEQADDAIADLEKAVSLEPSAPLWLALAETTWRWSAPERAARTLEAVDRAIALDETLAQAWLMRAWLREAKKDTAGALADLDRWLAIAPITEAQKLERSSELRASLGDRAGAIQEWTRLLELQDEYQKNFTRRQRGEAREALGDAEGALADYEAVIAHRGSTDPVVMLHPAWILASLGRHAEALVAWKRAADWYATFKLDPPEIYAGRGLSEAALGDVARARQDLEKALSLGEAAKANKKPGLDEASYHLRPEVETKVKAKLAELAH